MLKKMTLAAAAALLSATALAASPYDKPGFFTKVDDKGRLWVFQEGSKEQADFETKGEPAIHVSRIGDGPEGMTLKGPSYEVLDAYLGKK
ncbi:MAG TPA: hypothetical protein VFV15_01425 [Moraxellaceae bacterium]|nr:hypothetical protein [Moraxellaceae bacterium]